ncbi:MAG TPA: hypothetical protein PK036_13080 [Geobacteraceae bacterium]|nr:hypothetical protein [Geobacteraceae bacterium]
MKRIIFFLLITFLSLNIFACESQREKEERDAREKQKKAFGTWSEDVEKWNKARQKPTKPMWNDK